MAADTEQHICYCFDSDGYFVGELECFGYLANNSTWTKPPRNKEGFIQRFLEKTGKWVYEENHKGKNGYVEGQPFEIKEYGPLPEGWSETPPPPTEEEKAQQIRGERDGKISATDYLMLPDNWNKLSDLDKKALEAYRQALRDVTTQSSFPEEVTWPEKPSCVK